MAVFLGEQVSKQRMRKIGIVFDALHPGTLRPDSMFLHQVLSMTCIDSCGK